MKANSTFKKIFFVLATTLCFSACGGDEEPQIQSDTFLIENWQSTGQRWYAEVSYAAITQDIIDWGAVLVYMQVSTGGYNQVPVTFYSNSNYATSIEVSTYVGGFTIFWTDSDLIEPVFPGIQRSKVVVIPAGPLEEWVHQNPEELQHFKEASKALGLEK